MKVAQTKRDSVHIIGKPIGKKPVNEDSIEAMTPEKDRMVKGIFKNIEYPGQAAKICCRLYKGMQPFNQTLEDGQTYTIPLSVARHINTNCSYPIHGHLLDDKGNPSKITERVINRYQFISTDFN